MKSTDLKALLEYRKRNFAVKIEPSRHADEQGEIVLSVTHNGYQWTSISLLKSEIPQVVKALTDHITT